MGITPIALLQAVQNDLVDVLGHRVAEALAPEDRGRMYASKMLLANLLKKCISEVASDADNAALTKFLQANESCKEWSLRFETLLDELLVGTFRLELHRLFDEEYFDDLASLNGMPGPGASVGARGTDFYTKMFDSVLTTTRPSLYQLYQIHCKRSPMALAAEENRQHRHGCYQQVTGSRLSFVPKRNDISRVICIEPSLNMFFQKGIEERLTLLLRKRVGIHLPVQQLINRELAKVGSKTGQLSTIDLTSASDSISLSMCREFLPKTLMGILELFRSPSVQLPDGSWQELHMISSMGNGFTFPLQTIIFSAVVSAVYRLNGIKMHRTRILSRGGFACGNFGVNGDDIICETKVARQVIRLLNLLGFTENADKTFIEGPFRESCGGDFVGGYPVRAVYVKSLSSEQSRYVAFNRLQEWSAIHRIPLPEALELLYNSSKFKSLVPLSENDDAGFKVVLEYLPFSKAMRLDENMSIMYRPFVVRSPFLRIVDHCIISPKRAKKRSFNYEGLLYAFLGGYVSWHQITIRSNRVLYYRRKRIAANWNFVPTTANFGLEQLRAVSLVNYHRFLGGSDTGTPEV
jgi:hypothetical protein